MAALLIWKPPGNATSSAAKFISAESKIEGLAGWP